MEEIKELISMSPMLADFIKYVAITGVSGVIGNRFDSWFNSLFHHQRKNIVSWAKY